MELYWKVFPSYLLTSSKHIRTTYKKVAKKIVNLAVVLINTHKTFETFKIVSSRCWWNYRVAESVFFFSWWFWICNPVCNLTPCGLRLLFAQINSIQADRKKRVRRGGEGFVFWRSTESPSCATKNKPRPLPPSPSQDLRQEDRGQTWCWRMKGLGEREGVKSRTAPRTAPGLRILQHADIC